MDLADFVNAAGQEPTLTGANALSSTWYVKPAAGNIIANQRVNLYNNNTGTGGTAVGTRIVAQGPGAAYNSPTVGLLIDSLGQASYGTTSQNAIQIGNNWDSSIYGLADLRFNAAGNIYLATSSGTRVGIGYFSAIQSSPLATLDIRPNTSNGGTLAVASVSGKTSFAAMVVDNSGAGDIFTASASGTPRFVITNNGAVLIGTTLPTMATGLQVAQVGPVNGTMDLADFVNAAGQEPTLTGANALSSTWYVKPAAGNIIANQRVNLYNNNTGTGGTAVGTRIVAQGPGAAYNSPTVGLLIDSLGQASYGTTSQNAIQIGNNWDSSIYGLADLRFNAAGNIYLATSSGTRVGIGYFSAIQSSPLATLDIRPNTSNGGTLAVASVSGKTSFAAMVVDNSGAGDIFTASASGKTRFVITNQGVVGIGTNLPTLATGLQIAAAASGAQTQDLASFANAAGQEPTLAGINALQLTWYVKPASGNITGTERINTFNNNSGTGGTAVGTRIVAQGPGAAYNSPTVGLMIDSLGQASIGTTSQNAIQIGNNWDSSIYGLADLRFNAAGNIYLATSSGTRVGIGYFSAIQSSPLATLDIRPNTSNGGTLAVASVSGKTSFAAMVVDNSGAGDIFTASASGATRLTVTNQGNLLLVGGQSADLDTITATTLNIGTTNATTLTLGKSGGTVVIPSSTITLSAFNTAGSVLAVNGSGNLQQTGAGTSSYCLISQGASTPMWGSCISGSIANDWWTLNSGAGTLYPINTTLNMLWGGTSTASAGFQLYGSAASGTTPVASIAAHTSFAGLVIDNSGLGDIFTASHSGATRFTIAQDGSILMQGNTIAAIGGIGAGAPSSTNGYAVVNATGDQGSLVTNAGFESAVNKVTFADGWVLSSTTSATVTRDTGTPQQGNADLLDTTTNTNQLADVYSTCIPMSPQSYTMSYWQKGSAADGLKVRLYIKEYSSQANCQSNTPAATTTYASNTAVTASWAQITGALTVVAGTTWGRVDILIGGNTVSGRTASVDGVRLVETAVGTGLDYAENYPADPNNIPVAGEIVSLDNSGNLAEVTPTNKSMDDSVIGVVSTNPGMVVGEDVPDPKVPVALSGRVPVMVSSENGIIHVGDYLASSDIPGVAVKAIASGPVIGIAMEDYVNSDPSNIGSITLFIKNTYYNGFSLASILD